MSDVPKFLSGSEQENTQHIVIMYRTDGGSVKTKDSSPEPSPDTKTIVSGGGKQSSNNDKKSGSTSQKSSNALSYGAKYEHQTTISALMSAGSARSRSKSVTFDANTLFVSSKDLQANNSLPVTHSGGTTDLNVNNASTGAVAESKTSKMKKLFSTKRKEKKSEMILLHDEPPVLVQIISDVQDDQEIHAVRAVPQLDVVRKKKKKRRKAGNSNDLEPRENGMEGEECYVIPPLNIDSLSRDTPQVSGRSMFR